MARPTYRTRLEALIMNTVVSARDRNFAQSLLSYYERKGRLTTGRVKWVETLEERYSPENLAIAAKKHERMLTRLNELYERTEPASWSNGFVESLISQVSQDRRLSERQLQTLKKIEAEHDDAALAGREAWIETYTNDPTVREHAKIAAAYYLTTGYFRNIAERVLNEESFVPTLAQYNKMVKNKYAQKVLAAHFAAPKYEKGGMVTFRANAPFSARTGGGIWGAALKRDVVMVVIASDAAAVTSAAKGSKVYRLLPVGKAETILVEERYIMKARKIK